VLISRRDNQLQLVTQPDHAALAGDLARRWGNDRFAAGAATDSLIAAAARHDDGWAEIDGRPAVLQSEGRPAHFLEVPLPDTVGPYGAGIDRLYDDDRYAGVLASRHWAGLYSARWGVQDSPPVGHPAAQVVVAEQEERVGREVRELWEGTGLRSAFEARLWHDYEVLQALDFLSLAACLVDLSEPTDQSAQPIAVPATLRELDQPPGARLVPNVPAADGGYVTITLSVREPGTVVLDPYPLDQPRVSCHLVARMLPDVARDDPARAYQDAEPATIEFVVTAPDG
jgi:hypothetical protein